MALAPLLYNITFDSQTRILYFWDKAGREIYHCEIPSPAPAIDELEIIVGIRWDPSNQKWLAKTFSASDWWWCGILNQSDVSDLTELGVGIVTKSDVTEQWNGQIGAVEFNPNFDYSVEAMYSDLGQTQVTFNRDEFFIISKTSGSGNYDNSCLIHSLYATSTSVMAYKLKIKRGGNQNSCLYLQSDPLSMVESQWYPLYKMTGLPVEFTTQPSNVLGYFSAANEYDSLHLIPSGFTIEFRNNNNYLEVRQTNSLSQALSAAKIVVVWSSPAPVLPTVSVINGIVGSDSAYGSRNISSGGSVYQWVNNGGWALATVSSGNVIAFQRIANGSNDNVKYSGFDAQITQDGYVQVTNNTGSSYSGAFYLVTAVCSSSSATVITVYDSSNNPYNAFKYTSDGTDYYYVLDGTQTDWTDDLSGIGYSDQLLIRGWMKADKSSVTLNAGGWTNWQLLDDSGSILYVDTSKTYTLYSPKSGTMKINKSASGELYYEGTPSETIIVSDVIISVS